MVEINELKEFLKGKVNNVKDILKNKKSPLDVYKNVENPSDILCQDIKLLLTELFGTNFEEKNIDENEDGDKKLINKYQDADITKKNNSLDMALEYYAKKLEVVILDEDTGRKRIEDMMNAEVPFLDKLSGKCKQVWNTIFGGNQKVEMSVYDVLINKIDNLNGKEVERICAKINEKPLNEGDLKRIYDELFNMWKAGFKFTQELPGKFGEEIFFPFYEENENSKSVNAYINLIVDYCMRNNIKDITECSEEQIEGIYNSIEDKERFSVKDCDNIKKNITNVIKKRKNRINRVLNELFKEKENNKDRINQVLKGPCMEIKNDGDRKTMKLEECIVNQFNEEDKKENSKVINEESGEYSNYSYGKEKVVSDNDRNSNEISQSKSSQNVMNKKNENISNEKMKPRVKFDINTNSKSSITKKDNSTGRLKLEIMKEYSRKVNKKNIKNKNNKKCENDEKKLVVADSFLDAAMKGSKEYVNRQLGLSEDKNKRKISGKHDVQCITIDKNNYMAVAKKK